MALTEKLSAIGDAIREKTGKEELLTLAQMPLEIASIETGGGSSGGASGIYMAKITPAQNITGNFSITHNLGTTDILYVAVWAESLGEIILTDSPTLCKMWAKTDITTRRGGGGFSTGYTWSSSNSYADTQSPNVSGYEKLTISDENTISLPRASSGSTTYYVAGVTYTVLVVAANAEV